jgi:hypothetical protein
MDGINKGGSKGQGLFWLFMFSAAMGLLEAIVVVYLREIFYPGGFRFPLVPIPERLLRVEILREAATILMLSSVAMASQRGFYRRLAAFLFTFGVWDVFYYAGLKAILGWPPSLYTWDILFLIPVAWAAPVLAPLVSALTMAAMGALLIRLDERYGAVNMGLLSWILLLSGAFMVFITLIWDYASIVVNNGFLDDFFGLARNRDFMGIVSVYVPGGFNWYVFWAGEALILFSMLLICENTKGTRHGRTFYR